MCTTCRSTTYGQDQPEAREADKAKLDKVREVRETRAARRDNANLN